MAMEKKRLALAIVRVCMYTTIAMTFICIMIMSARVISWILSYELQLQHIYARVCICIIH